MKKLSGIRSKNKVIKKYVANIWLLCFINLNRIDSFYDTIKTKYRTKFPKYFNNFDKNYMNANSRFIKMWNYNEIIYSNLNNDMLFFTNNICESMNRALNSKLIWGCKIFLTFKFCKLDIIELYSKKIKFTKKGMFP